METKRGRELTREELQTINLARKREFGSRYQLQPALDNREGDSIFFLLKNELDKTLAVGKIQDIKITFKNRVCLIPCFSTVIALQKHLGYGRLIMNAIKMYGEKQEKTIVGFCETSILPFYQQCDWEVLSPEDNRFLYVDINGNVIPNIVPGEVIFTRGKDKLMEQILNGDDKTAGVYRN